MLPGETAQRTAVTKQGSCALTRIPLACSTKPNQHPPPPQKKTLPGFPYRHPSSRPAAPRPTPPSSNADRLATSASVRSLRPLATLRNHHPCHVRTDPAKVVPSGGSADAGQRRAAATVEDSVTAQNETHGGRRELWSPRTLSVY